MAVGTPEAFNINKWDDVTTSEAYSRKVLLSYSIATDGTSTRNELFANIGNHIDLTKKYMMEFVSSTGAVRFNYDSSGDNNGLKYLKFSNIEVARNGTITIQAVGLYSTDNHVFCNYSIDSSGSGSYINASTEVIPAGSTFNIYELLS